MVWQARGLRARRSHHLGRRTATAEHLISNQGEAVIYWTQLSIQWSRWYQDRKHVALTLAPPISDAVWQGNRITITLHPDVWVPLPLPPQAATQNLVLLILTRELADGYYDPRTKPMDRFWLARHMGLLHKQRNSVLNRAVGQAATWFSAHGGKLKREPVLTDGKVTQVILPFDDEYVPIDDEEMLSSTKVAFRFVRPRVPRLPGHRTTQRKRGRNRDKDSSFVGRSHGPGRRPQWPVIRDQNDIDEYFALVEKAAGEE